MPRGRPPKINEERIEKIANLLERGNTRRTAAHASGIGDSTLRLWLSIAREERDRLEEGGRPRKSKALYLALLASVERAEAKAEARHVERIRLASEEGTWQASAWWLERRRPQDFARRARVQVGGDSEAGPVRLTVEERQRAIDRLASNEEVVGAMAAALSETVDETDPTFDPSAD